MNLSSIVNNQEKTKQFLSTISFCFVLPYIYIQKHLLVLFISFPSFMLQQTLSKLITLLTISSLFYEKSSTQLYILFIMRLSKSGLNCPGHISQFQGMKKEENQHRQFVPYWLNISNCQIIRLLFRKVTEFFDKPDPPRDISIVK